MKNVSLKGANFVFFTGLGLSSLFLLLVEFTRNRFSFNGDRIYIPLLISQGLFLLPVIVYIKFINIDFKSALRVNKIKFLPTFLIIIISVPVYFVVLSLNIINAYIIQFFGYFPSGSVFVFKGVEGIIKGLICLGLIPAIVEEILHRGLILRAYEKFGSMKAVLVSSLLFGIYHWDIFNFVGPVFYGILTGYYVLRTNSIISGMIAHFINNFITILLEYFFAASTKGSMIISMDQVTNIMVMGVFCIVLAAVFFSLFYLVTKNKSLYIS